VPFDENDEEEYERTDAFVNHEREEAQGMAAIKMVPEEDATGRVKDVYEENLHHFSGRSP